MGNFKNRDKKETYFIDYPMKSTLPRYIGNLEIPQLTKQSRVTTRSATSSIDNIDKETIAKALRTLPPFPKIHG